MKKLLLAIVLMLMCSSASAGVLGYNNVLGGNLDVTNATGVLPVANGGTNSATGDLSGLNATPTNGANATIAASLGYLYYGPRLFHDFTQRYIPSWQTFTRASGGTYFDATGTLQTATTNEARYSHDPVTHAPLGLTYEEQRTNSLTNNSMVGVVAGTPGTMPTGWSVTGSQGGITKEIVGSGTEYGMPYVDMRWYGTASNTNNSSISFKTDITAAVGEVWNVSCYIRLVGGATTSVNTISLGFDENTSGGSYLTSGGSSFTPTSTLARVSYTRTLSNASVGRAVPTVKINISNGQTGNITLRLYAPQVEKVTDTSKIVPSSIILTTTATATRSADSIVFVVPSGVTSLRYVFSDDTYQDVAQTYGSYTIPTTLNSQRIKRVIGK